MNPEPGDILAIHTTMVFSRLIQAAQWTKFRSKGAWYYNHAAVYIGNGKIIEANPWGVSIDDLSQYPDGTWIVMPVQGDKSKALEKAHSLVGTPYGWVDIIALLFLIFGANPRWVDKINRRLSTVVCSQVAALAAEAAGDTVFPDPYLTFPAQIAAVAKSRTE
jgi:hypothetical protein